jgi:hypothetical protein
MPVIPAFKGNPVTTNDRAVALPPLPHENASAARIRTAPHALAEFGQFQQEHVGDGISQIISLILLRKIAILVNGKAERYLCLGPALLM